MPLTPARPARRPINPFRTLQVHRNFRLFWTGQTVSLIGTWMQQVGQGWLALELTNSAFMVGLVAAAGNFPVLLLSLYRTMLLILIQLSVRIAWMPIGYLGLRAIIWGLEEWFRKSKLSCDRAGLLAGQDVDAARRALMKLAGGPYLSELNPDAFREQAHEYDAVPDLRDSILKLLQLQGNTHPFAVVRFAELDRWATDGSYESILAGDYPRRDTDRDAKFTDEARNAANSYRESWQRSEDPLAGIFRGVAETGVRAASGLFDRLGGNRGSGSGSGSGSNDSN